MSGMENGSFIITSFIIYDIQNFRPFPSFYIFIQRLYDVENREINPNSLFVSDRGFVDLRISIIILQNLKCQKWRRICFIYSNTIDLIAPVPLLIPPLVCID